jgi:periplasmic protein TonB
MFDKLVESAKQKQGGRARGLFLVTGAVYAAALTALGVAAIIGISPALADEYDVPTCLVPPVPSGPAPQEAPRQQNLKQEPAPRFVPPKNIIDILPTQFNNSDLAPRVFIAGAPNWAGSGNGIGVPGAPNTGDAPPPPPPTPTPVVKPVATPTPVQVVRLTSMLTQGRVLRRVQPPYPTIARQTHVQGQVQVQIGISETGAVTDVTLLSGHPLLREAALQAAKQWLFIPTELNGKPVRAIGLLTFNFKLD